MSPLCTLAVAMNSDDRGHGVRHVGLVAAGIEKPLANIGFPSTPKSKRFTKSLFFIIGHEPFIGFMRYRRRIRRKPR
jgi:hypothetical protein